MANSVLCFLSLFAIFNDFSKWSETKAQQNFEISSQIAKNWDKNDEKSFPSKFNLLLKGTSQNQNYRN